MKNLNIGLFGFGVVGEGIYKVLQEKHQFQSSILKVCVKQKNKERNAPAELFTTDADDILNNPEINVVVELIDDADAALDIVRKALISGKQVVSANKKMIAENLEELLDLQKKHNAILLYEAAVCGSIPIIRNLEEYFDNDLLTSVSGIVNGSTNFILTKMSNDGSDYNETLKIAQEKGFAESNPTLDVEGIDAVNKLSIIILHSFGILVNPKDITKKGITSLHPSDFKFAKEKEQAIKLIAHTSIDENNKIHASVLPTFITNEDKLSKVLDEYNAVLLRSSLADEQFFFGKGAGRYPTSSAVLSDISALNYDYKYEYKKLKNDSLPQFNSSEKSGKFYLSFPSNENIDTNVFDDIQEKFYGQDRNYFIGTIKFETLKKTTDWKNENVSLIAYMN